MPNNKSLNYSHITVQDLPLLMPIENACHSHPWSEKTFKSCIGGRYFGEKLIGEKLIDDKLKADDVSVLGFYVANFVVDEATLMDICVLPSEQGNGYGKALLTQFIAQAKKQGAVKIFLEVRSKNIAAQMLYMNAGFIETGRRTGYYPSASGFGYEDAIVMSLSL